MEEATALDAPALGHGLIERATLEVTARDAGAAEILKEHLPPGARVHVTYLANGNLAETIAQASALTRAGFEPIPHVAARSMESAAALEAYVARIVGEAGARRVLLIAGDVPQPRGPFASSLDVLRTGVLERAGIKSIGFATHPEGHPSVAKPLMEAALLDKLAYAASNGLEAELVTQFCFEAAPIIEHITRMRQIGILAPVRIGLAAPSNPALLMKFAVRCGVGPSLRALTKQSSRFGKLIGAAGPEDVIADLSRAFANRTADDIAGLHFFVFGSVKKAAVWLKVQRGAATGDDAQ